MQGSSSSPTFFPFFQLPPQKALLQEEVLTHNLLQWVNAETREAVATLQFTKDRRAREVTKFM